MCVCVCMFVCTYVQYVRCFCLAIDDDDGSDSDDESGDQESGGGGQLFDSTASSGSELDLDDEGQADLAAGGDTGGAQRARQKSDGSHSDMFASSASGSSDLSDSEPENSGKPSGEVANGGQVAVS